MALSPRKKCGKGGSAAGPAERAATRLESGAAFMPDVSLKKMEKAAQKEKNPCAKLRLLACLGRKKGRSIRGISGDLKTAYSTVRDWLMRMRNRGLKGRFNARPKGRRGKLSSRILRTIGRRLKGSPQRYGFEAGSWQLSMIIEMIRRDFGILAKTRTLRRWLHRMGFSWRKSRYVPYKSAPEEKQEEFKKMAGERAAQMRSSGLEVLVEDEAAVQMSQNPSCGWRPVGGREQVGASYSKKSIRIFGAMSQDELRIKIVDSTNSETFLEFLDDPVGSSGVLHGPGQRVLPQV